jgi:hypothetical protein
MGRKRAMSLIRVYLLAKTFVFRNEHFQLVFKLKTILLKIRAQCYMFLNWKRLWHLPLDAFFSSLIESRTKGKNVYDHFIIPFSLMVMGFRILEVEEADQPVPEFIKGSFSA